MGAIRRAAGRSNRVPIFPPVIYLLGLGLFLVAVIFLGGGPFMAFGAEGDNIPSAEEISQSFARACSYLESVQDPLGSWGDRLVMRDTPLCLCALVNHGGDPATIDQAASWLECNETHNLDYLSRKVCALSSLGYDLQGILNDAEKSLLYGSRSGNGGYALYPGERENSLDTSLTVPALLAMQDAKAAEGAIAYLLANGCPDGGFSSFGLRQSDLPATAAGLKALSMTRLFRSWNEGEVDFSLDEAVCSAAGALLAFQAEDGGFEEQGSTPYETALALEALSWCSGFGDAREAALCWLLERQLDDGSIAGDLAATALLLCAARPEPGIERVELSDEQPPEGMPLAVKITLRNRGLVPARDVRVRMMLEEDPTSVLHSFDALEIPPLGTLEVEAELSTHGMQGRRNLVVLIEPTQGDLDFEDNLTQASFFVVGGYNLRVEPGDLSHTPTSPDCIRETTVRARVRNDGKQDAEDVRVTFYDGDPGNGAMIGRISIPFLGSGRSEVAETHVLLTAGEHQVHVLVDEDNLISELREDDNRAVISVDVNLGYDLSVKPEDITVSPQNPSELDPVTISALVSNSGGMAASGIKATFYVGHQGNRWSLGEAEVPYLEAGQSASISLEPIMFSPGDYEISVLLDEPNTIDEVREDDNKASKMLHVARGCNLSICEEDISFSPINASDVDPVVIAARVRNNGEAAASAVTVSLYDGDPYSGGIPLGSGIVDYLEGGGSAILSFGVPPFEPGTHHIHVLVNMHGTVMETNTGDNQATALLQVRSFGLALNLSASRSDCLGEMDVPLTVEVVNQSCNQRELDLELRVEDAGGGLVQNILEKHLGILSPGETETVRANWNTGSNPPGPYLVRARLREASALKAEEALHINILEGDILLNAATDR